MADGDAEATFVTEPPEAADAGGGGAAAAAASPAAKKALALKTAGVRAAFPTFSLLDYCCLLFADLFLAGSVRFPCCCSLAACKLLLLLLLSSLLLARCCWLAVAGSLSSLLLRVACCWPLRYAKYDRDAASCCNYASCCPRKLCCFLACSLLAALVLAGLPTHAFNLLVISERGHRLKAPPGLRRSHGSGTGGGGSQGDGGRGGESAIETWNPNCALDATSAHY